MKRFKLLNREQFSESVLKRDGHLCVFCTQKAASAHHILDRALWADGGYYLENGASVCDFHHMQCEMTTISVEDVRKACGIVEFPLPEQLVEDDIYDKWGNPIIAGGRRLIGEMFHNEGTQKMLRLGNFLGDFTWQVKYPRTNHVPWSEGVQSDDRTLKDMSQFKGREVVASVKDDGENSSLYCDYTHARSLDSANHASRNWLKNFWSGFAHEIPVGWRICGENLFARHSIAYENLDSYFHGFSMWDDRNVCLSWDDTLAYFEMLGITPVKVLYRGIYDEKLIRSLYSDNDRETMEGYVIRLADSFTYRNFRTSVAKFVRKGHVQTDKHWMAQDIIPNKLAKG